MAKNNKTPLLIGAGIGLFLLTRSAKAQTETIPAPAEPVDANLYNSKGNKLPRVDVNKPFSLEMAKQSLNKIKSLYGVEIARNVERIYRLETNHFKSVQFLRTYTAGMLSFSSRYPYGWTSFAPVWNANPQMEPNGYWATDINKNIYIYLAFPTLEAGMFVLAGYLQKYSVGRWNTTNEANAKIYADKVAQIKAELV